MLEKVRSKKYQPVFLNDAHLMGFETISDHLIFGHDIPERIVDKLSPEECFFLHDLLNIEEGRLTMEELQNKQFIGNNRRFDSDEALESFYRMHDPELTPPGEDELVKALGRMVIFSIRM